MDIDRALQSVLNEFVLGDCRLRDHPKLDANVRVLSGDVLVMRAGTGAYLNAVLSGLPLTRQSISGRCLEARTYCIVENLRDTGYLASLDRKVQQYLPAIQSYMVLPVMDGGSPLAVLAISSRDEGCLRRTHLGRAQLLAALIAYLIAHVGAGTRRPTTVSATLGKGLREVREELGLTQAVLADRMCQSRTALSRWESGAQPPSFGPLCGWCEALGVLCPQGPSLVTVVDVTSRLLPLLKEDPARLRDVSPSQFEQLIAELLTRMGYDVTIPTGTSLRDGGIDLIAVPRVRTLATFLIAGQVKHHRSDRKTGREAVDRLLSWRNSSFNLGLLVTNTAFTRDALWIAAREQNQPFLRLRDFGDLQRWLQGSFWAKEEWRELPDELELAPGLVVPIPRPHLRASLSLWPLGELDPGDLPLG